MKKLFSSVISLFTAFALVSGTAVSYAAADSMTDIDCDLSGEVLYLDGLSDFSLSAPQVSVLSNYSDSAYNYGDLLDDNNLAVYDALSVLTTPSVSTVSVKLPETLSISLSTLPSSSSFTEEDSQTYQNAVFGACKPGIDCVMFDMPEICWINMSQFGISVGSDTAIRQSSRTGKYTITVKTLTFTPAYYDAFGSLSEAKEYVAKLDSAVEDFPLSGETRYELLKSIHDYISEFTYYDTKADFASSALGALVQPGVVCEGYSKAFKLICDSLDIPCVLVFGNYNQSTNVAHMWNYVRMEDGKWYAVDVTWDDTDDAQVVKYDYFLKGASSFGIKHTPESEYGITHLTYPELSESDYVPTSVITTETTTTTTVTETTTTTTTATETTTTVTETTTTSYTETTTEPVYLSGDVNRDGEVSIADLVYCQNTVLAKIIPEYSCDVNGDGVVNSFDVVFIRRILIK